MAQQPTIQWVFQGDNGKFVVYEPATSQEFEANYQRGKKVFFLKIGGWEYGKLLLSARGDRASRTIAPTVEEPNLYMYLLHCSCMYKKSDNLGSLDISELKLIRFSALPR